MFDVLARSVAVGVLAAGALLSASGVAFAHPHGDGDGDYMDIVDPPWAPPAVGPGDLTSCPPGKGWEPSRLEVVGAHDGALIMGTRPAAAVPSQSSANEVAIESVTITVESIEEG